MMNIKQQENQSRHTGREWELLVLSPRPCWRTLTRCLCRSNSFMNKALMIRAALLNNGRFKELSFTGRSIMTRQWNASQSVENKTWSKGAKRCKLLNKLRNSKMKPIHSNGRLGTLPIWLNRPRKNMLKMPRNWEDSQRINLQKLESYLLRFRVLHLLVHVSTQQTISWEQLKCLNS